MSSSLIKKGLQLLDEDFIPGSKLDSQEDKRETEAVNRKSKSLSSKLKPSQKKKGVFLDRKVKNILETKKNSCQKDQTKTNIAILRRIDGDLSLNSDVKKIKQKHTENLARKTIVTAPNAVKSIKTSKSVFTEEDFGRINDKWLSLR